MDANPRLYRFGVAVPPESSVKVSRDEGVPEVASELSSEELIACLVDGCPPVRRGTRALGTTTLSEMTMEVVGSALLGGAG